MSTPSFLSEYELAREKLMARNAKKMEELGLFKHKATIEKAAAEQGERSEPSAAAEQARKRQQERRAAARSAVSPEPTRASGRLRNKPAPVYRDQFEFLDDWRHEHKAKRRRGGGGGAGSRGGRSPWDNTSW